MKDQSALFANLLVSWVYRSILLCRQPFLRKKSTFPPSTIAKVWFSSLNYKIGNRVSPNYQNRLFYLHQRFYKQFYIVFSIVFSPFSLFSLNRGSKRGLKKCEIGIVVEESTKNPILQTFEV